MENISSIEIIEENGKFFQQKEFNGLIEEKLELYLFNLSVNYIDSNLEDDYYKTKTFIIGAINYAKAIEEVESIGLSLYGHLYDDLSLEDNTLKIKKKDLILNKVLLSYSCADDTLDDKNAYIFEDEKYINDVIKKNYPVACGVTADNRPNISFKETQSQAPFSLWYHTTFNKKDDALDFLKDVFKDGVLEEDIGADSSSGLWLSFDEMQRVY